MRRAVQVVALVLATAAISIWATWMLVSQRIDRLADAVTAPQPTAEVKWEDVNRAIDARADPLFKETLGNLDAINALRKEMRAQVFALRVFAHRETAAWWCMAGGSHCFRGLAVCAARHAQGELGCEPRRVAYCRIYNNDCYGDDKVCTTDDEYPRVTKPVPCAERE